MKKRLFLLTFALTTAYASAQHIEQSPSVLDILQKNQQEALFDLLKKTGLKHNGTFTDIVTVTQKAWLRPKGKERWQLDDIYRDSSDAFMPLFDILGMLKAPRQKYRNYDYALILGGMVTRMRKRLALLISLWNNGIRFKHLVWLVGDRALDQIVESQKVIWNAQNVYLPFDASKIIHRQVHNEIEAARLIYEQADGPKQIPVPTTFVAIPQRTCPDGTKVRPRTSDTIKHWLTHYKPAPGSVLALSNQPYIGYQKSVLETYMPESFEIDVVGAAATKEPVAVMLDTLARWLYQELNRLSSL